MGWIWNDVLPRRASELLSYLACVWTVMATCRDGFKPSRNRCCEGRIFGIRANKNLFAAPRFSDYKYYKFKLHTWTLHTPLKNMSGQLILFYCSLNHQKIPYLPSSWFQKTRSHLVNSSSHLMSLWSTKINRPDRQPSGSRGWKLGRSKSHSSYHHPRFVRLLFDQPHFNSCDINIYI